MWQTIVIATLTCVLGYMVGHDRGTPEMAVRVQQGVANESTGVSFAETECLDSYTLAQVVGDEVSRRLNAALPVEPVEAVAIATDPVPAVPLSDPRSEAAGASAQMFVDNVLVSGVWVDENRGDLDLIMMELSEDQGRAVMEQLIGAMNDGTLSILTSGPPI